MTKFSETDSSRKRLFISYKRRVDPDENVALQVYEALKKNHDVFIDQRSLRVGMDWAKTIEEELAQSDFLISFLSESSVGSEMVRVEIETANRLCKERQGKPAILPVRLNFREPFRHPLSAWLNPINWALWMEPADTPRLIEELKQAIEGGNLSIDQDRSKEIIEIKNDSISLDETPAPPRPLPNAEIRPLEPPQGTMSIESFFYVTRSSDQAALNEINQQGRTLTIKGPRQMGKSSLLIRTIDAAKKIGKRSAFLDFQLFGKDDLANADSFLRQFCSCLSEELGLENRVAKYWEHPLPTNMKCTKYVDEYLLKEVGGPIVLALDEVDSIYEMDFRSDFFAMLRSWHNKRSSSQTLKQLDMAFVISTEPYLLIDNQNQSPFNVGELIELQDFTKEQVADLNRRHETPLNSKQEGQLIELVGGHPYLVRRALYQIANRRISVDDLFDQATEDSGPFGDHLRYHIFRLRGRIDLIEGLKEVISFHTCKDNLVFYRLRDAGLVRKKGREVLPRCKLYTEYFSEHLDVKSKA